MQDSDIWYIASTAKYTTPKNMLSCRIPGLCLTCQLEWSITPAYVSLCFIDCSRSSSPAGKRQQAVRPRPAWDLASAAAMLCRSSGGTGMWWSVCPGTASRNRAFTAVLAQLLPIVSEPLRAGSLLRHARGGGGGQCEHSVGEEEGVPRLILMAAATQLWVIELPSKTGH